MPPMNMSVPTLRALTLAQRPEMQMARAKIDGEKSKLQLAHRAWIPDPAISVQGQRYNDAAQGVSELDAGVSFTVPWVNPAKIFGGRARGAAKRRRSRASARSRANGSAAAVARSTRRRSKRRIITSSCSSDKLVPQAQQAFEANRFSYESGKASFLDWISAQRNLRDIEAMAREHLADYQVAVAELEAVVGARPLRIDAATDREERSSK